MIRQFWSRSAAAALLLVLAAGQAHAIDYANITVVDGTTPHIDPPMATINAGEGTTAGGAAEGFFIDAGATVGEIPIRIGASAADDAAGGILLVSVSELWRTPISSSAAIAASSSTVRDDDPTSTNTRNASGGLAIVTDRAGNNTTPGANFPVNGPMNANVAAAYFPFSQGWKGGTAWASTDNGAIDTFAGSAGITFNSAIGLPNTANVRPNYFNPATQTTPTVVVAGINNDGIPLHNYDSGNAIHNGHHYVSIPGIVDTRQQGILFAMSAKNEDNFAGASATADGSGWHVNSRDNAQNSPNEGESKPFSFVFMPLGTPNVTMGAIWGAAGQFGEPTPVLKSGANFTVNRVAGVNGQFRLTIDGHTPTSGALIVGTQSNTNGDGGLPADNLVTYVPDGNGWLIYSDDLQGVNVNPINGQNGQSGEPVPYFHFAFLPFNAPPSAPGAIPAPKWNKESVFAYRVELTEIDGRDNDNDDFNAVANPTTGVVPGPGVYGSVVAGTPGQDFILSNANRGDQRTHVSGALPSVADGVMLATISEDLRNNSATNGINDFGVVHTSAAGGQWKVSTAGADPTLGEANLNYAVAFFGANSGFAMGANAAHDNTGFGTVTLSGVNSTTDGVLMATAGGPTAADAGAEDNFVTVDVKTDGTGWDVRNLDNGLTGQNYGFNYVYLPYDSANLVAGRVNTDGTLVNSTAPSGFSLTKGTAGEYLLTINGKTPDDGMLLLTPTGPLGSADNTMVYEADGNTFRILGIDLLTQAEKEAGGFTNYEDTSFSFAYIDYAAPPVAPSVGTYLEADFNENGVVDSADLLTWKNGFDGGTTKATGDANGDGDVDGADFLTWQRQLGTFPPATVAAGAVPEPHAAMLALLAAMGAVAGGRRRAAV